LHLWVEEPSVTDDRAQCNGPLRLSKRCGVGYTVRMAQTQPCISETRCSHMGQGDLPQNTLFGVQNPLNSRQISPLRKPTTRYSISAYQKDEPDVARLAREYPFIVQNSEQIPRLMKISVEMR